MQVQISQIVQLEIATLVHILLIIFATRDRDQLSITYDYNSQLRLVKLCMVCIDISRQKRCCPKFMSFWVNSQYSLAHHKRGYMIFFYHREDFFDLLVIELRFFIVLEHRKISIRIRCKIFMLHLFDNLPKNFPILDQILLLFLDKSI